MNDSDSVFTKFIVDKPAQPVGAAELSQAQKNLQSAQNLLTWLQRHWNKATISERQIRIYGPNCLRNRESARESAEELVRHGWLNRLEVRRHDMRAWEIVRKPILNPTVAQS
jgi:hypothetical protein